MTATARRQHTRRIVVVFGGGSADASVEGVLDSLVSGSPADVAGVFLEDHTLFRVAELPFMTEVCRVTTVRRPLTKGELERQMRIQAIRAEQAVRRVAERAGLPWSFRKHRGRLGTALAEARDVDVLLVGTTRGTLVSAGELSATARMVRARESEPRRPVAVLAERSRAGERAIRAGIELAERTGRSLVVFAPPAHDTAPSDVVEQLRSLGPGRAALRSVPSTEPEALRSAVRRAAPAVLVVGADESGFEEAKIGPLQRELRCPMVVVR